MMSSKVREEKISADYGVLLDSGIALRGLFLIDKAGVLRHVTVNDLPLGRNVDEVLRMIDALHHFEQHGEVCPAGWKKGDAGASGVSSATPRVGAGMPASSASDGACECTGLRNIRLRELGLAGRNVAECSEV